MSKTTHKGSCRANQLQQLDHNKVQEQPYSSQSPYTQWVQRDALVLQFGTVDDNFDNIHLIASIDVTYNPLTNQITHLGQRHHNNSSTQHTTETKITRVYMVPYDTRGNRTRPNIEVRYKNDMGKGADECINRRATYTWCWGVSKDPEATNYVTPETGLHSFPPYSTKHNCAGCILNVSMVLVSLKIVNTIFS